MNRRRSAFTLIELLIASCVSVLLAAIIYTIGSEALITFARNISINRSYTDARLGLERIANAVQSAGHTPVLVDSNGVIATTSAAAGCRFYRYSSSPTYIIPSGNSSASSLSLTIPTGQLVPSVGDLAAISQIGFQGTVTSVSCTVAAGVTNAGAPVTASLGFANSITSGCVPALTAARDFTPQAGTPSANPPGAGTAYSCQIYTQVAFIAVPPTNGVSSGSTPLRYYKRAISAVSTGTACGGLAAFNNATAFNNPANFKVIASLPLNATAAQILPFQVPALTAPTLNIVLCAEGPDYNNRGLHIANTFSQMRTSLGARCPLLLRGPF